MKVNIGLQEKHLARISAKLNTLLADEAVLYIKTRNFHWNVKGPTFIMLHNFFEGQYEELAETMDSVAERIRNLGHTATGSMAGFIKGARIKEAADGGKADAMLKALLEDHEAVVRHLRNDINDINDTYKDAGTADFLTGIMELHEKMAWMLRSHLE